MKRLPIFSAAFALLLGLSALILVAPVALQADEPVNFSKLIPFLPKAPEGWTSETPDGSTTESGQFKLTTVGCNYSKGEGDAAATAAVNIIDSSNNQQFMDSTTAGWSFSQETPDGYTKSLKIDEFPGFETYDKGSKTGSIWVIVAKRFLIHIDLTNQEPAELQKWLRGMDLKKLAALK